MEPSFSELNVSVLSSLSRLSFSPLRSWYFCIHLLCLLLVLLLPVKPRHLRAKEQQANSLEVHSLQPDSGKHNHHSATDNNCNQKHKST